MRLGLWAGISDEDQGKAMQGVPVTPSGEGAGWLARWLSVGGEGVVSVSVSGIDFASGVQERDIQVWQSFSRGDRDTCESEN
jgi:hypothetical protein